MIPKKPDIRMVYAYDARTPLLSHSREEGLRRKRYWDKYSKVHYPPQKWVKLKPVGDGHIKRLLNG